MDRSERFLRRAVTLAAFGLMMLAALACLVTLARADYSYNAGTKKCEQVDAKEANELVQALFDRGCRDLTPYAHGGVLMYCHREECPHKITPPATGCTFIFSGTKRDCRTLGQLREMMGRVKKGQSA